MRSEHQEAEAWLRKAVHGAPSPLPPGMFPTLLDKAERAGFTRCVLDDVVDEWLNYGYCQVTDPITNDIVLLPKGESVFGRHASVIADAG